MGTADYLLLGLLLLSALVGLLRGFIREALSLVSWIGAAWMAVRFGNVAAAWFVNTVSEPIWQLWAGRVALFVGVLFAGSVVAWLIGYVVRRSPITGADRVLGMLFGLARGVILAGIVVLALELAGFGAEPWWAESKLLPYAARAGAELRDLAQQQLARQPGDRL
jgi:membrane protein required for colicin V production